VEALRGRRSSGEREVVALGEQQLGDVAAGSLARIDFDLGVAIGQSRQRFGIVSQTVVSMQASRRVPASPRAAALTRRT
jgi:hypothetical protein